MRRSSGPSDGSVHHKQSGKLTIPSAVLLLICFLGRPVEAQYSGGTGEPNAPYQIATAEDLIALGETPDDYDKHFILTADIDLDPNLPGRKVFDRAVIAWDPDPNDKSVFFQGTPFAGVFDGNGHVIYNLTISGYGVLGLFGYVDDPDAEIMNLGMIGSHITLADPNIVVVPPNVFAADGRGIGSIVGYLVGGRLNNCFAVAITVAGYGYVGGLVGLNGSEFYDFGGYRAGTISRCYCNGEIEGVWYVGGLAGVNLGAVTSCYSFADVTGRDFTGGLIGENLGTVANCYSLAAVTGRYITGGLVGTNGNWDSSCERGWNVNEDNCYDIYGTVFNSYASGVIAGTYTKGGVVGSNKLGEITNCFWDTQTSGQTTSDGGTGLTTADMQTAATFLEAGWDFMGETANGPNDIWKISEGLDYPRLWWEKYGGGTGEPSDPYLIYTAEHLNALGAEPNDYNKRFKLMADIDLSGYVYDRAVIAPDVNDVEDGFQGTPVTGVFDGNNHKISNLTIDGAAYLGLFGHLGYLLGTVGEVRNLGLEAVHVDGTDDYIGGVVGYNCGSIAETFCTGSVSGGTEVGGLVGSNFWGGNITASRSAGTAEGEFRVGGLVGYNFGSVAVSFSTGTVTGDGAVGGLVGENAESIANCYSTCAVSSTNPPEPWGGGGSGGLVGVNVNVYYPVIGGFPVEVGTIDSCYSTGAVYGYDNVGGLVGISIGETAPPLTEGRMAINGFWDVDTSGLTSMCGEHARFADGCDNKFGKTTAEMQTANTFIEAGWDFVDEVENGTEDIWWILEGQDYPRLWWELIDDG